MVAHEVGRARGRAAAAANGVRWWFGLARAGWGNWGFGTRGVG